MKRKTNYKNLISLALVLILLLAVCVPSSFAIDNNKRRFGAMIMSALQAINITMQSTLAPAQNMLDAIADPPGYVGIYEYPWEPDWDNEILDRSSIQIWPDYTEIDGVKYTDVWLSHDAAEKFRVNAFDFKTAYNITSESTGTFADGAGYLTSNGNTIQMYNVNNEIISTGVQIPAEPTDVYYQLPLYYGYVLPEGTAINQIRFSPDGQTYSGVTINRTGKTNYPITVYNIYNNQSEVTYKAVNKNGSQNYSTAAGYPNTFVASPFDFDWVSGIIPADQVLPQDTGMMIRVPSNSPGLQTFITNNVEFTNEGGVNLDFELHPELEIAVDDLLDIIAPIVPVINTGDIQFTVNHEAPIPPVPDTPIIDATVPQVVNPIINEITNYGDQITEQIPQIIETIPTIDSICENIDTAPYHDLDTGLDHLPSFFLPFITDLRSALGIWHYVTEWLAQISSTFAFVTGCLVGTSIMTPIYAAIAGFMCIKIYRRMTS